MAELTEDQLNEMGEELLERMVEAEKQKTRDLIDAEPEPVLSKEVPSEPVTMLTPEAQAEVAGDLARAQQDPIVPKQMTRQVWKQMMRIHFTIRRGKAQPCGHKLSSINVPNEKGENSIFITSDPRKNCDSCWFTYFNTNGQMTNIADECFREAGRDVLERSRGSRFVKYFLRFMSTVARFQREASERAEANGTQTIGTEGTVVPDGTSGGGDSTSDQGVSGVAGEARNIGGISEGSDPSISAEEPFYDSPVEGLGTGLSGL